MRNPTREGLDFFADKILELVGEGPDNMAQRLRIKAANETGLLALKKGNVERYDEVQRALARKG